MFQKLSLIVLFLFATHTALAAPSVVSAPVTLDQTTPGTSNAVSEAYIGSTAVATGNGVAGAGVQRVTIASDNSAVPVSGSLGRTWSLLNSTDSVNAVQSGIWTLGAGSAVIGHVIADTSSAVIGHVIVDSGTVTTSASSAATRADTFTVATSGTTVNASTTGVKYFSIECKGTGAVPTAWNIVLEGSLDNTNFTTILTHTNTVLSDGQALFSGTTATPALYFRSRLVSVTLGSATNIVCTILGV